jgi:hypothetical protein
MLMKLDNSPMANELRQHMASAAEQRRNASGDRAGRPADGASYTGMYQQPPAPASELQPAESVPNLPLSPEPQVSAAQRGPQSGTAYKQRPAQTQAERAVPEDQPEAFGSVRSERPYRSTFDDDDETAAAVKPSYGDLRSQHRQAPQQAGLLHRPPAGDAADGYDTQPSYGARGGYDAPVNSQGLTDPTPKPTHPSDAMRHPQRYTKYGDPIEE